jgi:hypothetical protein
LVTLTGSGWGPGESVHIFVNDTLGKTWQYNADFVADVTGGFTAQVQLPNTFISDYDVTATGAAGDVATTAFTDSQPQSVTVATTSKTVAAGAAGSAAYGTVAVTVNGNSNTCTITLAAFTGAGDTGLPTGVTASFSPNPNTVSASYNASLTVNTTPTTAAGTYTFHVQAQRGAGCQGNGTTDGTQQLTLVVAKRVGTVTVGAQSGTLNAGGAGNATYVITVNRNGTTAGAFTAGLTVSSSLPTGVTASFNPDSLSFSSSDNSKTSTLTLSTTTATPSGTTPFTVRADSGVSGDFSTGSGSLTIGSCAAPAVTTQPTAQSITYGANASFSAAASGSPTVQWQVSTNGGGSFSNVPGATATTLTLTKPTVAQSENQYRAVFTNGCGSATTTAVTLTVAQKALTITGAVAQSKVYDGNLSATVDFTAASLLGVVSGDTVTINSSGYSASFANGSVGTAKPVTVLGVTLGGGDAGNYSLSQPSGLTATISRRPVSASIVAAGKVYDGGADTTATCSLEAEEAGHGVVGSDDLSCAASNALFASAAADTGKTVTADVALSGDDQANYQLTSTSAATTADITPKPVSVSFQVLDKVWDGNTTATIKSSPAPSLNGIVGTDNVVLGTASATATFATAAVGSGKTVTGSGFTKSGSDAGNYMFATPQGTTTASILAWNAAGKGFYAPVGADAAHSVFTPGGIGTPTTKPGAMTWNTIKGGQTVPLKFNVFAGTVEKTGSDAFPGSDPAKAFQMQKLASCTDSLDADPVDFVASTGQTTLRYDTTGKQWIENWATPKVAAPSCYRTFVTFADGSTLEAFFQITK